MTVEGGTEDLVREAERASPSSSWRRNFQTAVAVKDAPSRRAAARRSPNAILDSRNGLENGLKQELNGEARYGQGERERELTGVSS